MLMPSIFGENFMDDFFGVPERTYTQSAQNALMKTDRLTYLLIFSSVMELATFTLWH